MQELSNTFSNQPTGFSPTDEVVYITKVKGKQSKYHEDRLDLWVRYETQAGGDQEFEFTIFSHADHLNRNKNIFLDILKCLDNDGKGYLYWTWKSKEPDSKNRLSNTRWYIDSVEPRSEF